MPEMGRPSTVNPFQGIKKFSKAPVGNELNELAGIEEGRPFVDKNQHNKMDKNTFLKLLSNQLQNQDPFNPTDQKKFAADLAQFSQLEQLANLNSKFEKKNAPDPRQLKFMGASFLGKKVLTKETSLEHSGERGNLNLPFTLPKPAQKLMVRIFDQSNGLVGQMELGGRDKGAHSILWDGRSLDGRLLPKGRYRFEVHAWDQQFNPFRGETKAQGVVTAISFERGEVVLTIDGKKKAYLRDVDHFSLAEKQRIAEKSAPLINDAIRQYNQKENKK